VPGKWITFDKTKPGVKAKVVLSILINSQLLQKKKVATDKTQMNRPVCDPI
jgi:hypothetical protein